MQPQKKRKDTPLSNEVLSMTTPTPRKLLNAIYSDTQLTDHAAYEANEARMARARDTFRGHTTENRMVFDLVVALATALQREGEPLRLLDIGTEDSDNITRIVQQMLEQGLAQPEVMVTDIRPEMQSKVQATFRERGLPLPQGVFGDMTDFTQHGAGEMLEALGVTDDHAPDVVLFSHVGYYVPSDMLPRAMHEISGLTHARGVNVSIHSDGDSTFDRLRVALGAEIHAEDNAMQATHGRIMQAHRTNKQPFFEVRVPASLLLPNAPEVLKAAFFADVRQAPPEMLARADYATYRNILEAMTYKTPYAHAARSLGEEGLQALWNQEIAPAIAASHGREHLALSLGGGRVVIGFGQGVERDFVREVHTAAREFARQQPEQGWSDAVKRAYNPAEIARY